MGYREAAKEAADCLSKGEQSDWRVAQLTYENTLRGRETAAITGKATMEVWCGEVQASTSVRLRFGEATGSRYARIWAKYGVGNGTGITSPARLPSFKDVYAEVDGTPDRERMMEYEANRLLEQGTPEQKTSAAVALMRDPVVVDRIAEAAVAPDSEPAQALEGLNDRVVEQRLEAALDEPTESMETVARRIKQAKDDSAAYQYDRLKQTLSAFFARYSAEDVAEAIVASPHTDRIDLYLEGSEQVVVWFRTFHRALRDASRPRLVGVAESAS